MWSERPKVSACVRVQDLLMSLMSLPNLSFISLKIHFSSACLESGCAAASRSLSDQQRFPPPPGGALRPDRRCSPSSESNLNLRSEGRGQDTCQGQLPGDTLIRLLSAAGSSGSAPRSARMSRILFLSLQSLLLRRNQRCAQDAPRPRFFRTSMSDFFFLVCLADPRL